MAPVHSKLSPNLTIDLQPCLYYTSSLYGESFFVASSFHTPFINRLKYAIVFFDAEVCSSKFSIIFVTKDIVITCSNFWDEKMYILPFSDLRALPRS